MGTRIENATDGFSSWLKQLFEGRLKGLRDRATRYDELRAAGDINGTAFVQLIVDLFKEAEQLKTELRQLQKSPEKTSD